MFSKDQIIKNNAVEIDKNPKRLTFFKDLPPSCETDDEEGAYEKAFAENYGSGAYGADAYEADLTGDTQAGSVPGPMTGGEEVPDDTLPVSDGRDAGAGQAVSSGQAGVVPGRKGAAYKEDGSRQGAGSRRQVEELLREAREQAEALLREAREQAEGILRDARQQEDVRREEMRASLVAEALPQALEEGRETGRQAGRREWDEAVSGVQRFYESLERLWHDELARVDEELLELALKISERMVGTVLKYDKEKLLSMIRGIILLPNERRNLKIHVSDADWEWLRSLQDRGLPPYPLIRDEGLQPGNVLVQSSEGIFDAQLETQLDKFREVLSEELINGQLESLS